MAKRGNTRTSTGGTNSHEGEWGTTATATTTRSSEEAPTPMTMSEGAPTVSRTNGRFPQRQGRATGTHSTTTTGRALHGHDNDRNDTHGFKGTHRDE